jgi:penicillin amidase
MPSFDSGGCASVCVMVLGNGHGASERLALSPAHPDDALLQMPGGQSGHFLSVHYADQQLFWQDGRAMPLRGDTDGALLQVLPE